jgi:hypothetical protein
MVKVEVEFFSENFLRLKQVKQITFKNTYSILINGEMLKWTLKTDMVKLTIPNLLFDSFFMGKSVSTILI